MAAQGVDTGSGGAKAIASIDSMGDEVGMFIMQNRVR